MSILTITVLALASAGPAPVPRTFSASLADAFQDGVNVVQFVEPTAEEVDDADRRADELYGDIWPGPARVGFVRRIDDPAIVANPGEPLVRALDDGRSLWTLAIESPGAKGLRLHVTHFDIGDGAMVLYSRDAAGKTVVRGPFSGRGPDGEGEFWTPSLSAARVFVEVVSEAPPQLTISEVLHFDRGPGGETRDAGDGSLSCNLDVNCAPAINPCPRNATGRMSYIKNGEGFVCTGTLIADFDPDTLVPYFLTANHCIDTQEVVNTLEVFWFYENDDCDLTPPPSPPDDYPSSLRGTLLHQSDVNPGNDASFIRLGGPPLPPGICLAGTTTDEEQGVVGVHHPSGSYKRKTYAHYESLSTDCGLDCGCFTAANYAYYKIDEGIIQGGSSGSGMFDAQGRILGQLFGHCTLCPDSEDCAHDGDWCLMYGEWAQTYPDVVTWLQLGGTIHVDDSNPTPPWNGTPANPYFTVVAGQNALWDADDLRMVIHVGNYAETPTLNRRVTITAAGGLARIGDLP